MTEPHNIRIKELRPINIEGGFLVDGFPSIGFTSAIATESLIHTSQFELGGIIDSDIFPPVSIIKDGVPNYPTRIFVNEDLKVAVFSSYLTLHESLHRTMARQMLDWAKQHKLSLVVSSVAIPGIPGALLNEGMLNKQDVVVILFNAKDTGPDFKASVDLCMAMAKLVPGVSCNIESLLKDAETAEKDIKETEQEARHLKDSMYR
jgi:uncharacterized protein